MSLPSPFRAFPLCLYWLWFSSGSKTGSSNVVRMWGSSDETDCKKRKWQIAAVWPFSSWWDSTSDSNFLPKKKSNLVNRNKEASLWPRPLWERTSRKPTRQVEPTRKEKNKTLLWQVVLNREQHWHFFSNPLFIELIKATRHNPRLRLGAASQPWRFCFVPSVKFKAADLFRHTISCESVYLKQHVYLAEPLSLGSLWLRVVLPEEAFLPLGRPGVIVVEGRDGWLGVRSAAPLVQTAVVIVVRVAVVHWIVRNICSEKDTSLDTGYEWNKRLHCLAFCMGAQYFSAQKEVQMNHPQPLRTANQVKTSCTPRPWNMHLEKEYKTVFSRRLSGSIFFRK